MCTRKALAARQCHSMPPGTPRQPDQLPMPHCRLVLAARCHRTLTMKTVPRDKSYAHPPSAGEHDSRHVITGEKCTVTNGTGAVQGRFRSFRMSHRPSHTTDLSG